MPARGKFIVLEGIDGSGKRTQMERLAGAFAERGVAHACLSFPRYEGFFGRLVARFLNGEFGPLERVDPHFSALLYAGDRFEAKPYLEAELTRGAAVLADRYIASNLAHQGARVAREGREAFLRWLRQLEYEIYGLPAEDLVVYLRLPAVEAQGLVGRKGVRDYTTQRRDLQEADLSHLEAASQVYDGLARQRNWVTIECFDAARTLRPPDSIHRELLAAVEARLFSAAPAG